MEEHKHGGIIEAQFEAHRTDDRTGRYLKYQIDLINSVGKLILTSNNMRLTK
jgi:hypothetical protein